MARPQKRKAAKDYPQNGIKKGDTYFYVKIKTGARSSRIMRQLTAFTPQQLTSSEYQISLYDWADQQSGLDDMDNAQELADAIRQIGEEQTEKRDNMPEGLQQGSTGELLEERANACEQAASEIEEIISNWESAKSEYDDAVAAREEPDESWDDSFLDEVKGVSVG